VIVSYNDLYVPSANIESINEIVEEPSRDFPNAFSTSSKDEICHPKWFVMTLDATSFYAWITPSKRKQINFALIAKFMATSDP